MIVRLLTDRAGTTGYYLEGDTLEVPEAEARRMIAAGQAEPIGSAGSPREKRVTTPQHKR